MRRWKRDVTKTRFTSKLRASENIKWCRELPLQFSHSEAYARNEWTRPNQSNSERRHVRRLGIEALVLVYFGSEFRKHRLRLPVASEAVTDRFENQHQSKSCLKSAQIQLSSATQELSWVGPSAFDGWVDGCIRRSKSESTDPASDGTSETSLTPARLQLQAPDLTSAR